MKVWSRTAVRVFVHPRCSCGAPYASHRGNDGCQGYDGRTVDHGTIDYSHPLRLCRVLWRCERVFAHLRVRLERG